MITCIKFRGSHNVPALIKYFRGGPKCEMWMIKYAPNFYYGNQSASHRPTADTASRTTVGSVSCSVTCRHGLKGRWSNPQPLGWETTTLPVSSAANILKLRKILPKREEVDDEEEVPQDRFLGRTWSKWSNGENGFVIEAKWVPNLVMNYLHSLRRLSTVPWILNF